MAKIVRAAIQVKSRFRLLVLRAGEIRRQLWKTGEKTITILLFPLLLLLLLLVIIIKNLTI